jgi:hypothetical protein
MIQFASTEIIKFADDNSTALRSSMSVDEFELQRSFQEKEEDNRYEKIVFNRMSTTKTESPLHLPERQKSDDLGDFFGMIDRNQTVAPALDQPLKRPERRFSGS